MNLVKNQPGATLLAAAALVVAAAGGTAVAADHVDHAAVTSEPVKITVCVGAKADHLRLVPNRTTSCRSGEKLLSWNKTGEPGKTGRAGNGAYYIATLHGYDGSRAQWLMDLNGADGANGSDGADGLEGTPGQNGLDGADGANGTDGAAGLDGLNAYELAAEDGFEGTRSEWLVSLAGADGAVGPQGPEGPAGQPGPQGPPGDTGPAGAGVTADSYYDLTYPLTSMTNSTMGITFGCHEGDVATSYHFSLATGNAALIHAMPQGTRSWDLGFKGTTNANTDSVGVRCLDL